MSNFGWRKVSFLRFHWLSAGINPARFMVISTDHFGFFLTLLQWIRHGHRLRCPVTVVFLLVYLACFGGALLMNLIRQVSSR